MFRLYEPAFAAALEDWGNLSKKLRLEKENLQLIMNSMSQAWVGETQRDSENIMRDMTTTGLYQQTAEVVEMIYRIQYNLHPEIIAQMERCEKMGEQLLQDGYLSPYLMGSGYHNDGYLILDDTYVAAFNCAVTEVLEQANEARSIICEAMDACDGMIDFSAERESLEAGFRKVKRIENFATEFNKYVIEVKRIEEEIVSSFRAIIANDPDPTNQKWNQVLQNLTANKNVGYRIPQVSTTGMYTGKATLLEPAIPIDISSMPNLNQKNQYISDGAKYTYSTKETVIKYIKKTGKAGLDVLGKAGAYGKEAALPIALLKNIIDGDGITGKDIGSTIKGMGNSIIGMCDAMKTEAGKWPLSTADIKELAGWTDYPTISTASTKAGWLARLENAGTSAGATLKKELFPKVKKVADDGKLTVDSVKVGIKVAGWALSLVANGFSNYDEYKKGGIAKERAAAETVTETLVDIGKNAAILAGVAAGCAAIGVAAPVAVVTGIGVGVSFIADIACENLTGKSVTEATSDFILDTASEVGEAVTGAAQSATSAVSGWFDKVLSGGGEAPQYIGG